MFTAGDLSSNGNSEAMEMRTHGNGMHSRGPSQSNISDTLFDDCASYHSASAHQPISNAFETKANGAFQSPDRESEHIDSCSLVDPHASTDLLSSRQGVSSIDVEETPDLANDFD